MLSMTKAKTSLPRSCCSVVRRTVFYGSHLERQMHRQDAEGENAEALRDEVDESPDGGVPGRVHGHDPVRWRRR